MIKQGIKNYFVSLKYAFTIIGIFALGVILGLSVLIPGLISAISKLVNDVKTVVTSIELDFDAVGAYLLDEVRALDYSNARSVMTTVLSRDWIEAVLIKCLDVLVGGGAAIENDIKAALDVCIQSIMSYLVVCIAIIILSMVIGYYFTKWLVRRGIARRSLWKFLLVTLVDSVLSVAMIVITTWLAAQWWVSVFITVIADIILVGLVTLFEAYMVHGKHKVKLKEIVNFKNIFKLLLTNIIVFVLAFAISVLVVYINLIVGIFIAVSFVSIAIIVTGMNAEAYVKSLADKRVNEEQKNLSAAA